MIKVLFVGDKPSKFNVSSYIPFVGAKCFPRLVEWIRVINPDYYIVMNSDLNWDMNQINILYKNGFKVVALGNKAASKLLAETDIDFFKLPHPSGLNRKTNNKAYIDRQLLLASKYVRHTPDTLLSKN